MNIKPKIFKSQTSAGFWFQVLRYLQHSEGDWFSLELFIQFKADTSKTVAVLDSVPCHVPLQTYERIADFLYTNQPQH